MTHGRIADAATGAIGDTAGAIMDPAQGIHRLRGAVSGPALVVVVAALVVGYLIGRRSRR
ncbi:hypothetical protein [Micromonospora sp. NBC_01796]|uniref:hypothetical protein n=1 Tax=Micromonospora sp. NBC_01796 TaxID=2975987 RepID=UPI002DD96545|nr:hypothetical protein [Micromonospora sp. NBC_01796]WSA85839.1 hypothetical protein OIE47_36775 [Micromonospora sp. NBC_01796]